MMIFFKKKINFKKIFFTLFNFGYFLVTLKIIKIMHCSVYVLIAFCLKWTLFYYTVHREYNVQFVQHNLAWPKHRQLCLKFLSQSLAAALVIHVVFLLVVVPGESVMLMTVGNTSFFLAAIAALYLGSSRTDSLTQGAAIQGRGNFQHNQSLEM